MDLGNDASFNETVIFAKDIDYLPILLSLNTETKISNILTGKVRPFEGHNQKISPDGN